MSGKNTQYRIGFRGDASLERAEQYLAGVPGGAQKAVMRAMNRAIQGGATTAGREIAKAYTVKVGQVRKTISIQRATKDNMTAIMTSKGRYLSQASFQHRPQGDTTGNKRKPVKVAIKKGQMRNVERAFVWKGHIFQRVGAGRTPLDFLYGPSIPIMLSNDDVKNAVGDRISEDFEKRLEHETQRLLEGEK